MTVSADPPKTARELVNTTTGLVPSARQDASSACVACRLARRPRSKSASHSPLTAAARWKISSAPASAFWAKPGSPRSPRTTATRESAARSGGTGTWSTRVSRDSARGAPPATASDPAASSSRASREPRKPAPPVTTTCIPASYVPGAEPELPAGPLGWHQPAQPHDLGVPCLQHRLDDVHGRVHGHLGIPGDAVTQETARQRPPEPLRGDGQQIRRIRQTIALSPACGTTRIRPPAPAGRTRRAAPGDRRGSLVLIRHAEQWSHHPRLRGRCGGTPLWYGRLREHRRGLPIWNVCTALMLPL